MDIWLEICVGNRSVSEAGEIKEDAKYRNKAVLPGKHWESTGEVPTDEIIRCFKRELKKLQQDIKRNPHKHLDN